MKNITIKFAQVAIIAGSMLAFATVASAWTGPVTGTTPPANNVAAPINVGSGAQIKTGDFQVNGLLDAHTSALIEGASQLWGHVDIGPYDCPYHGGTLIFCASISGGSGETTGSSGSGLGSIGKYFAANSTKSLMAGAFDAFKPATVYAAGTLASDALHVNGDASFTGAVKIQGQTVCLGNGAGCYPIGGNPTLGAQGAYIGWNSLTGGTGETDFINQQGGGSGGFEFVNATNATGHPRTNLMTIAGNGNVSIGSGATPPRSLLDLWGGDLYITGADHNGTLVATAVNGRAVIGDNTPTAISIDTGENVHFLQDASVAGDLDVAGSTSTNVLNAETANINKLNLAGVVPIYRENNISGMTCNAVSNQNASSARTGNPSTGILTFDSYAFPPYTLTDYRYCYMSGGFHENILVGYTIPAAPTPLNNALGAHVTGLTLGTPNYGANTVPGTISFHIDGGGGFPLTDVWVNSRSGSITHTVHYNGTGTPQPGSDGAALFSGGNIFSCSATAGTATGYDLWVDVWNTAGAHFGTSAHFSTSVGNC